METNIHKAIAIVGVGAILPDAPNAPAFWNNVKTGRYSISDVPMERWDPALYYDPDPNAPDKSYSKIGGWVREYPWEPMKWKLPIPPKVADAMDIAQKWAVACTREALEDYGYPKRPLDLDRTAVILGNAMAGEKHYLSSMRVFFPEYARELAETETFAALPEAARRTITNELHERIGKLFAPVTEDTMPGELANCMAGRIANLYNFHGPNYICDAACASTMAALNSAVEGLIQNDFDVAVTGGIDRNMGAPTFVKFCKIGALSATGTRPYAQGADGFVMGEGAVVFLLKRLADAERDQDKTYAVLRGIGGSSDGRGKGITAPNPVGQKFCIERAWENAGLSPATVTLIEGHGTSTRVGDLVETQSMVEGLNSAHLPVHSVALGSVKSNIGHLKSAAGAAGILKTAFALRDKVLPPSLHCEHPSADIDFAHSPLYVNTELKPWAVPADTVRRAGVSAFGFGGTNFHIVMEEHIPGRLNGNGKRSISVPVVPPSVGKDVPMQTSGISMSPTQSSSYKAPLRGALVLGAESEIKLMERLREIKKAASGGVPPPVTAPAEADLRAPERLVIDYGDAAELATKADVALKAFQANQPAFWKAIRAQGIFRGSGAAPKVAFLYTGQGSQYVNMLRTIRDAEPTVEETFAEADRIMTPILGKKLSEFIYVDGSDTAAITKAEDDLRQTAITQPAILATDLAMTRLLAVYGIEPHMTMGHSLGEYGALVASGGLPFADALEAVAARGREMTRVSIGDNGKMAAVFAPLKEIEKILKSVNGYVVIANVNSENQAVVGGASKAVEDATELFLKAGYNVTLLPVSHAFHTQIVAPASEPLRQVLTRLRLQSPRVPIVANVNGEFYPTGADAVPKMLDILARQIAAPVQFVKGLRTLYEAGARVFIEVGPKKALQGFAEDVLGGRGDVVSLFTNHPKLPDIVAFNQALCGLYAAGLGTGVAEEKKEEASVKQTARDAVIARTGKVKKPQEEIVAGNTNGDRFEELGHLFAEMLERGWEIYHGKESSRDDEPVAITGAALGLPGTERIFDDSNVCRILRGDQFIRAIPEKYRKAMLEKHVTRLVKSESGTPSFEVINNVAEVIKLAGRGGAFDLEKEFGISGERLAALDRVTCLAIAVGLEAMRDAGIPLVMRYKTTSKGTKLPDRWGLPDALRDDTGVIFASAFPGYDAFAEYLSGYYTDLARHEKLQDFETLRAKLAEGNGHSAAAADVDRKIEELRAVLKDEPYELDRRFLFRTLSMGHSQFAEFIGARGPNTQINSACASTSQAVTLAEDWIRAGRCRRVIIVSADDVTSDHLMEWIGAGFLASGAAATDERVEDAATPFDRRRHGLIVGMGAASLVVESAEAARERGLRPICEVLSTSTANSAFHGTRLDVQHIGQVMEQVISQAERHSGISRSEIAPKTVFVSHETYTPARGGSASAEIYALRRVFGDAADQIVIANTKGMTGHAMATGIEEVVAVKALETGWVPPVANFKEIDPELGALNLSKGGTYPVEYALRLGAGFGSQISMTLLRRVTGDEGVRPDPNALGYAYRIESPEAWKSWLSKITGDSVNELEVVNRTLRVRDKSVAARMNVVAETAMAAAKAFETPTFPIAPVTVTPPATTAKAALPEKEKSEVTVVSAPLSKAPDTNKDEVKERVLALVVEKTGYPADMLDLDLDLEADLGVDTVKQAEIFAAIREIYKIPRDENRKLRDFPTLAHVLRFVHDSRRDLSVSAALATPAIQKAEAPSAVASVTIPTATAPMATAVEPMPAATITSDSVRERVLELLVEKTGYPKEMLDLDLDLEADLGIDTVKQAELFAAIREIYKIPRDDNRKLRDYPTLAHVIRFVCEQRPDLGKPASSAVETKTKSEMIEAVSQKEVAVNESSVQDRILGMVVEKTGYPKEMLDVDLDLEADLGIDTVKQAELFAAVREIYKIPRDENRKLRDYPTLAHVIRFVLENRPATAVTSSQKATAPEASANVKTVPAIEEPVAVVPVAPDDSYDAIKKKILEIVAEKTGYPSDMLDLDLDLEADLGVDTVKQAEMFAAVRAAYNIPRDEALKLRDFPTLAHVIRFAQERKAGAVPLAGGQVKVAERTAVPAELAEAKSPPLPLASFDAANRIPRRVPVPNLRPPLAMCKPTSVTLEAGDRVVLMPDKQGVCGALTQQLREKGVEVLQIDERQNAEELITALKDWVKIGTVKGVYWLSALDDEGPITSMDIAAWHEAIRVRVKSLYATMRVLYEQICARGTFLVSATRLGGQHGYDEAGASAPMGGAVVGFTKAYKRERSDALVKAIDFEIGSKAEAIAEALVEETLRDNGAVEIGYKQGLRWTIGLAEQSAEDGLPGLKLGKNSVFVVTGAAGSIVSAITTDLATASGGTFYLLDMVPEPEANNPDLKRFAEDKDGLKRDLFARIQARGQRATPALVEKELAALERAQAALAAIDAVRAAGGTPRYFSVNLTDADAVAKVIEDVRQRCGRIDVLLHAAGLERSHFLPDKDPREFDLVFDVKADGWFNLLHAIVDMPLGATVAFSSIAGRFGNGGQTDYSSANDMLCKFAWSFRTTKPLTRGIAIDWTAWGGIGMATRGSIPKMMEIAGIDMLLPEAGVPLIRRELTMGGTRGEVVIGQRLGALMNEWDEAGGLEATPGREHPAFGPMIGKFVTGVYSGFSVKTTLDPKAQPFLNDHRIDGTPVLPGVMGIEAFAEAALSMCPGWRVEAIENVNFLAPFKFYRDEARTLTIKASFKHRGEKLVAECELNGERTLPSQTQPQVTTHFTARVLLTKATPDAKKGTPPKLAHDTAIEKAQIYRIYFHGPAYQVLERAWWDGTRMIGEMPAKLPNNHEPAVLPTLMGPRLIELCFQAAGMWELAAHSRFGLPQHVERVECVRLPESPERLYAIVTPCPEQGSFDAEVVDTAGNRYVILSGYSTAAFPNALDRESATALQRLMFSHAVAAA